MRVRQKIYIEAAEETYTGECGEGDTYGRTVTFFTTNLSYHADTI